MIVHEPEIIHKDGEVYLQARIETKQANPGLPETFWMAYPAQYEDMLSLRADTFLPPMLQIASTLNENLEVRGQSSPRLVYGLHEYLKILHHWQPGVFHLIEIKPDTLSPAPAARLPQQFATTFSGGLDSFYTLQQETQAKRLSHALFIHGCAGFPLVYEESFESMVRRFTPMTQSLGVTLIPVRTNAMHFSAYRIELRYFLESPLISSALGISPFLSGLFIPSDGYDRYTNKLVSSLITPLLRTEQFTTFDSDCAVPRFAKTQVLADWAPAQENLRVCLKFPYVEEQLNCSTCAKCMRTRMTLHVLGKLDRFTTFRQKFTLVDYLRWGRWMEAFFFTDIVRYVFQKRRALITPLLLGMSVGYFRRFLRKTLPKPILRWIFKQVSPEDRHTVYSQGRQTTPIPPKANP